MRITAVSIVAAVSLLPAVAFAQDNAGKATGQLVIGDKTFPLTYAYADTQDDVEQVRTAGPQKSLTLLLSAEAVTKKERDDWFALTKRTRAEKLHAVQLNYDPVKKQIYAATIFYVTPGGHDSPLTMSISGPDGEIQLESFTLSGGTATGSVKMKAPSDWLSFDDDGKPPRQYDYSVAFSAPVINPVPVTANLTGKAAQASPQIALATKLFKAIYAGDLATLRTLAPPDVDMEERIKKEGAAKVKQMLRQFSPPPAVFAKMPKHVVVRGDTATVIAGDQKTHSGSLTLKMIRKNGKWIVSH